MSKSKTGVGRPGSSRRGFLGVVGAFGASALATSAVVFGTGEAASAYTVACCHLSFAPSVSLSTCRSSACYYSWGCATSTRSCSCCEVKNCSTGLYTKSAYGCIWL